MQKQDKYKNNSDFESHLDLAAITFKLMQGDTDETLRADMERRLSENYYAPEFIENMSNTEHVTSVVEEINRKFTSHNPQRLIDSINKKRAAKRRKIILSTVGSIAAAVLLITLQVYNPNKLNEPEFKESDKMINTLSVTRPTLISDDMQQELITNKVYMDGRASSSNTNSEVNNLLAQEVEVNYKDYCIVVPQGYNFTVILCDGTSVMLNAKSELYYTSPFKGDIREVTLKGEAYFDVTKSDVPFKVNINEGSVKVYGTSFNIKHLDSTTVETVLVSGSVSLSNSEGNELMLKPNQKATLDTEKGVSVKTDVDVTSYLAWTHNNFTYLDYNVKHMLLDLEKWYGIKITDNENIISNNLDVDFNISRESDVTKTMTLLEQALDVIIIRESSNEFSINKK